MSHFQHTTGVGQENYTSYTLMRSSLITSLPATETTHQLKPIKREAVHRCNSPRASPRVFAFSSMAGGRGHNPKLIRLLCSSSRLKGYTEPSSADDLWPLVSIKWSFRPRTRDKKPLMPHYQRRTFSFFKCYYFVVASAYFELNVRYCECN